MAYTNTMADTTFLQIFKEFNDLLNRHSNKVGVITHETDKINVAVSPKDSPETLIQAIEEAIKDNGDYEDVAIVKVEDFDYGYSLEATVSYVNNGEECNDKYYISHTQVY